MDAPLINTEDGAIDTSLYATGFALTMQHYRAMMSKRWCHAKRNSWAVFTQLLVPGTFVLLALIIATYGKSQETTTDRNLHDITSHYGSSTILYGDSSSTQSIQDVFRTAAKASDQSCSVLDNINATYFEDTLLRNAGTEPRAIAVYNKHNIIAVNVDSSTKGMLAWFNGQAYHSVAESLSYATNLVLSSFAPAGAGIQTINAPFPRSDLESIAATTNGLGLSIASVLQVGMSFLAASFVTFIVKERASKAKHMQFLGGVTPLTYWTSSFVFDYLNYLVPTLLTLILFKSFAVEAFTTNEQLWYVTLLLLSYGLAVIPLTYMASFFFDSAPRAYSLLALFNVVTGLVAVYTIYIMQILKYASVAVTFQKIFIVLPTFCFGQGFMDLYTNYQYHVQITKICHQFLGPTTTVEMCCANSLVAPIINQLKEQLPNISCPPRSYGAMESPGIGKYVLAMALEGIVLFVAVIVLDSSQHRALWRRARDLLVGVCTGKGSQPAYSVSADTDENSAEDDNEDEDEDVAAERARIELGHTADDVIVLESISKEYSGPWFGANQTAVDRLSVGVEKGTCFGLLGVNGAGKTSTFKMLTGDEGITSGTAQIDGHDIKTDLTAARQRIGYAPQFDALIDRMTGRELLTMFANLRGIPPVSIPGQVTHLLTGLGLARYADKFCNEYSGGNKRKLSAGIALIGSPPIVLLDEPTSGMDPMARRFLWRVLRSVIESGRSIILTSHSMEECESLCSRLGIMVHGKFKCLGGWSPTQYKSKWCSIWIRDVFCYRIPAPFVVPGVPTQNTPRIQLKEVDTPCNL